MKRPLLSSKTLAAGRMSAADFRAAQEASGSKGKKAKSSKFNAVKVKTDEGTFDSKMEYRRWNALCLLEKAGEISDLQRQIPYSLDVNGLHICKYIADFIYIQDGKQVVEDSKGYRTPDYKIKRSLMKAIHGIDILETGTHSTRKR